MTEKEVDNIRLNTESLFHFNYSHMSVCVCFFKLDSERYMKNILMTISDYTLNIYIYIHIYVEGKHIPVFILNAYNNFMLESSIKIYRISNPQF